MKKTNMFTVLVLGLIVWLVPKVEAEPMGSAITYQGRLMDKNRPADGLYDFQFKLYDSNDPCTGTELGSPIDINDLDVIDGHFIVELDFGSGIFDGNAVWLETMVVRSPMGSDPATLSPLLELTPTPYALYAQTAPAGHSLDAADGSPTDSVYVDDNGNVGIGTTSPGRKLDVAGYINASDYYLLNNKVLVYSPAASGTFFYGWDASVKQHSMSTDGVQRLVIDNSGNVGIGTTNPSTTLDVAGTVNATAFVGDGSGLTGIAGDSDWAISGNDMYSIPSGNVGIGTTNPLSKLSVGGDGIANIGVYGVGSYAGVYGRDSDTGAYGYFGFNTVGVYGGGSDFGVYGGGSEYGVYGYGPGTGVHGLDTISGSYGHIGYDTWGGYFFGDGYFSGNVGIGTTTPLSKLHVEESDTGYAGNFEQTGPSNTNAGLKVTTAAGAYGAKISNQGGYSGTSHGLDAFVSSNSRGAVGGSFRVYTLAGYNAYGLKVDTSAPDGTSYGIRLDTSSFSGMAYGVWSDVWAGFESTLPLYGIYSEGDHAGTSGATYGMYSKVYGSDEGHSFGIYSEGIKRSTDTAGAAYGGYFIGNNYRSNGESYGVYAQATDTEPNSTNYGIYASAFTRDTESYGVYARAGGSSDSTVYGIYVDAYNYIGDGNSYGVYAKVTGYGGTHYGIYAEAENGTTNYAGYFVGTTYISDNVGIGTTSPDYELDVSGSARLTGDMAVEGRISIGTTNFGTYKLFVSGPAYSTGGWLGSDRRFKEYIETIDSPLDKIKSIKGVSFEWKTSEYKEKGFPEGRHFGVIAQEVEEVLPEIVKEGPDGDKAVSYTELVPILTEAIKQQQKQIENLQYEVKTLKEIMHQHKLTVAKEVQ